MDLNKYPNLMAVLDGRVSEPVVQWPAVRAELHEALSAAAKLKRLVEEAEVVHQIADSFWAALKSLNLPAINVENPGIHVTELVARLTRLEEEKARLLLHPTTAEVARLRSVVNERDVEQARLQRELNLRVEMLEAAVERASLLEEVARQTAKYLDDPTEERGWKLRDALAALRGGGGDGWSIVS